MCVSRLCLAHDVRRAHDLALSCGELTTDLRHGFRDLVPPAFRKSAAQDSHQFRLGICVELFGSIKNIIKR